MMVINLFGVFITAGAEEKAGQISLADGYELIDTAYGNVDGEDIYLAVARKYGASANSASPLTVYRSNDNVHWERVFSSSTAYHSAHQKTRTLLVYWPAAELFALHTGDNIYTTHNGAAGTWDPRKKDNSNQGILRGNGVVAAGGDTLIVSGGRASKIATPDTVFDANVQHYIFSDNDVYTAVVGATEPNENGKITIISYCSNGMSYIYTNEVDTATTKFANIKSVNTNMSPIPYDMVYEPNERAWLLQNGTSRLYKITETGDFSNFAVMNQDNITAVGADDDIAVIGTADGSLFYTDSTAGVDAGSVWKKISAATGNITEEVRSITPVDGGSFLVVTKSKIYFIVKTDGEYKSFGIANAALKTLKGQDRIIVPVSGSESVEYSFASEYVGGSYDIIDALDIGLLSVPNGVEWNGEALEVSSECEGGEVEFEIILSDGRLATKKVNVVAEKEIVFEGATGFVLDPTADQTETITAYIAGTDGSRMEDRSVTLSTVSVSDGMSFDPETGIVTIDKDAKAGELIIKAVSNSKPSVKCEKTFLLDIPRPRAVSIISGETSIVVPDESTAYYTYKAEVLNQANRVFPDAKVSWSIGSGSPEGVSIDSNGQLSIADTAYNGTVRIIASATEDGGETYSGEREVTLTFSALRLTKEDIKELQKIDFTGLKNNITLPLAGSWGSEISWSSSSDKVITADGAITKLNKKENTAKLTAKLVCTLPGGERAENSAVFDIVVARNDIVANGDIETGTAEQFTSDGEISVTRDKPHSGKYALKSDGSAVSFEISQPEGGLEKDSSYYIEAYVYAPDAKRIYLKSDNFKSLNTIEADDDYVKLVGSLRTVKAVEDKIIISVDNASGFVIDDITGFDMTAEYDAAATAVSRAESTKTRVDVDAAKELLNDFYDCPAKDEFLKRLDGIKIGSDTSYSSGGGGGGGGASSAANSTVSISAAPVSESESEARVNYAKLMFKDMDGHWAKDEVETMGAAGVISGRDEGVFDPEASVTRAEFAVLITKTMGLDAADYENTFFDVIADDWYSGYVQAARNAGYLTGSNGLFLPNNNITREEIARIVVSAYAAKKKLAIEQGGALYYSDVSEISSWAYDYVVNAVNLGFMQGMNEYSFAPKETATRAQAAVILKRLLDKLAE